MQVVREDPKNKDLLYVGTEFGLFISLDGGQELAEVHEQLPTVRTDDILVHPRDNDLIVATHGAQRLDRRRHHAAAAADAGGARVADAALFDIRPAVAWLNDQQNNQQVGGQKVFVGENAPRGAAISYYLKSAASGDVKITIADVNGRVIRTLDGPKTAGINRVMWNLAPQPAAGGRPAAAVWRRPRRRPAPSSPAPTSSRSTSPARSSPSPCRSCRIAGWASGEIGANVLTVRC